MEIACLVLSKHAENFTANMMNTFLELPLSQVTQAPNQIALMFLVKFTVSTLPSR